MPKTRPDGSPLTPDDLEYWDRPYIYQEFPKMPYRRPHSGIGQPPSSETYRAEGTTKTPDGTVLEFLTIQSATEQAAAGRERWADLPAAMAR
jgi:hypothetical protein